MKVKHTDCPPFRSVWALVVLVGTLTLPVVAGGASFSELNPSVSVRDSADKFDRGVNYRSFRGVPIQKGSASPTGTGNDGRIASNPTPGQFSGFVAYGAVVRPAPNRTGSLGGNYEVNAQILDLPRNKTGPITMVLRAAIAGASTFSRQVTLRFGQVIPPPLEDISGNEITLEQALAYWEAEPHNSASTDFYFSPHAQKVYAIKSGPVSIRWRLVDGQGPQPAGTAGIDYVTESGFHYPLKDAAYVVSGNASKAPQTIFWTEGTYRPTGKPVSIPQARVRDVKFLYNTLIPALVSTNEAVPTGQPVADPSGFLRKTIWFDEPTGQILAYNKEGRILMELLGDVTGPGTRAQLGIEIVDVSQAPVTTTVTNFLGNQITAYQGRAAADLSPEPLPQALQHQLLYLHTRQGDPVPKYFAVKETAQLNDVQIHWMRAGVAGLKWPTVFNRSIQVWPTDPSRYSHYLRPRVGTDAEARLSAVSLPNENAPFIQFQDPLDGPRGHLTKSLAYYTHLTDEYPWHRGLLRFTTEDEVAFERVFSVLSDTVKTKEAPATAAAPLPVDIGQAGRSGFLNLDGATGFGQLPGSDSGFRYFGYRQPYTVEGWVYVRSVVSYARLIDFGQGQSDDNVIVSLSNGTGGKPYAQNFYNREAYGNGRTLTSNTALSVGRWVHLAYVFVPKVSPHYEGRMKVYFDGVLQAENSKALTPLNRDRNECYVGKSSRDSDGLANGAFDNLRIWSVARTPTQLAADMNQDAYPAGTAGLRVQFTFDEVGAANGVAQDSSGNDRHMSLHGAASVSRGRPASPVGVSTAYLAAVPRAVTDTAIVGERIVAPAGEAGAAADESYLAGHLRVSEGDSYFPAAYTDPLGAAGFTGANAGAIIPVNAIPGQDTLEVWWFRENATNDIQNRANGFLPVYWPAVVARYTLQWPTSPSEIVLASNDGSGGLPSLEATGSIYVQNDPTQAGYNPNEEHALLLGGQAFALRDDLNLTAATTPAVLSGANATYSSAPHVLLSHTDPDGRPRLRVFKVLREKPAEGILFDYVSVAGGNVSRSGAGSILQAPMPLPLLPPPTALVDGVVTNYNQEPVSSSAPAGFTDADHGGNYPNYASFTFKDRKENFWVHRGPHGGPPGLAAGTYSVAAGSFGTNMARAVAIAGTEFEYVVHSSRLPDSLVLGVSDATPLPEGLGVSGLKIVGTPTDGAVSASAYRLNLALADIGDGSRVFLTLELDVRSSGTAAMQGALEISRSVGSRTLRYVGRPPNLTVTPTAQNSFAMRFYYKNQEGFAWPGITTTVTNGQIVPYLRPAGSTADPADRQTPALDVIYRPVWPGNPPQLSVGQTLTVATVGLPAMRGQTSVEVLYQQGTAASFPTPKTSVVLHDPTREKHFAFGADDTSAELAKIPAGVAKEASQGKTFFPRLPPHLVKRLFFDPNVGAHGSLIFRGEFKDELLGEKYILLNAMTPSDIAAVTGICPDGDGDKTKWDAAINGLATTVEVFREEPAESGLFVVDTNSTFTAGITNLPAVKDSSTAVDSFALTATGPRDGYLSVVVGNGNGKVTPIGEPVTVYVMRVMPRLHRGELKIVLSDNPLNEQLTLQHSADLGGKADEYEYEWKIGPPVDGFPPLVDATMSAYQPLVTANGQTRYTLGSSGIQGLIDNYVVMRYRPTESDHPLYQQWSEWVRPQLAEGWIKRVLAGINPFNQRVTDFTGNQVSSDASLLIQAGRRWEGDIPLSLANINDFGLIEIYETVLNRGKGLSIDAGINFAPANDALMLAAGYINDLYMFLGNEAFADAANPTIGINSSHNNYGSIATALFAFKGQLPSLLEEELALLRGRSDFAQPGVELTPLYNRLIWNYTRGIDAGEVIYALNYNILDQNNDGAVDATDAATLFPQGHGDAYGHYLTALKGYYRLLLHPEFEWIPRIEAVTVLGQPVTVDYLDERKFATAAAAVARTGLQVYELEWRRQYDADPGGSWAGLGETNATRRVFDDAGTERPQIREWGVDQWAARTGQGAYLNFVVGNAMLPAVDPDPSHEGIQKIDRTTVLELHELPAIADNLQQSVNNAEGRLAPLGIPQGGLVFDINPDQVISNGLTHFEQVFGRAKGALQNASVAFDDTKGVTALMRGEQDSVEELQTAIDGEERSFTGSLIEIYGSPYTDDIGPGKTFAQGYEGPDLVHYSYVDLPEHTFPELWSYTEGNDFPLEIRDVPGDWQTTEPTLLSSATDGTFAVTTNVSFNIGPHGFFGKPPAWTGRRASPGKLQQAGSEIIAAHTRLRQAWNDSVGARNDFVKALEVAIANRATQSEIRDFNKDLLISEEILEKATFANDLFETFQDSIEKDVVRSQNVVKEALPESLIAGLAAGGDLTSAAASAIEAGGLVITSTLDKIKLARLTILKSFETANSSASRWINFNEIAPRERTIEKRSEVLELGTALGDVQVNLWTVNEWTRKLDDAWRKYRALEAEGLRVQLHRESRRKRAAAIVQGFRTRDAAFRIFRNEKLERYKALFDLAARYTLLAANAYDYETGLLATPAGRDFVRRIVNSRALGVMANGEPQFAGSNTGDPGLSSVLAEMKADWDVLRGRLGFNNPQKNSTTVSLRTEKFRLNSDSTGDLGWRQTLQNSLVMDLTADPDVARHCLQVQSGPGIVLEFGTVIADGTNLFGRPLAPGDHNFSPTEFATKIYAAGVALPGYEGMDDPAANANSVGIGGGTSPADPPAFGANALAATPYLYLIPAGADSMRSPPLGDQGGADSIRTWLVSEVAVPLPFNIGASDFSNKPLYRTSDSLTEPLFGIRKHPAFRPVADPGVLAELSFNPGSFFRSKRLIGRSVWNSRWKIVIPGRTLLNDPDDGLARFLNTVKDIKLNFITYSYSGN
jgi:hypothetical protein